jgi:hypothetical protein
MGRVDEHFVGHWQISYGPGFAPRRIGGALTDRHYFRWLERPGRAERRKQRKSGPWQAFDEGCRAWKIGS